VTRIRGNALYRVIERRPVAHDTPVTSDQVIEYTGKKAREDGLPPIRRIGFRDPVTGKHYVFITNQFKWSAQTNADIYQQRWQVELFFKWIKQNLKIKAFLGISQNFADFDGIHTGSTLIPKDPVLPRVSRQVPRQTFPSAVYVYHSSSSMVSRWPWSTARSRTQTAKSLAFQTAEQPDINRAINVNSGTCRNFTSAKYR
jgi:hypothetical protein